MRRVIALALAAVLALLLATAGVQDSQARTLEGWDARTYTYASHPGWPYPEKPWSVNWRAVATCESSLRWDINTGNGYFGGLQFSLSTWLWYGGDRFAYYPHQATRYEQRLIAQRTLNGWPEHDRPGQGIGAWPICGQYG